MADLTQQVRGNDTGDANTARIDMKIEMIVVPVSADANWPDWYAEFLVREQTGEEQPE